MFEGEHGDKEAERQSSSSAVVEETEGDAGSELSEEVESDGWRDSFLFDEIVVVGKAEVIVVWDNNRNNVDNGGGNSAEEEENESEEDEEGEEEEVMGFVVMVADEGKEEVEAKVDEDEKNISEGEDTNIRDQEGSGFNKSWTENPPKGRRVGKSNWEVELLRRSIPDNNTDKPSTPKSMPPSIGTGTGTEESDDDDEEEEEDGEKAEEDNP